jgi:hypothetical protein
VRHPQSRALHLDDPLDRKERLQRRLVRIAGDGLHRRPQRAKLLEERDGGEVAGVQDQVGGPQSLDARIRQPPRAPREVRVGDDRDERYRSVYGAPTRTVVRARFVAAATRTAVT